MERRPDTQPVEPPKSLGQYFLDKLGMGFVGETVVIRPDGTTMVARDFLDDEKCRVWALPVLTGWDHMDSDNQDYIDLRDALRTKVGEYIGIHQTNLRPSQNEQR